MTNISSLMKKILKQPASEEEIAALQNSGFKFKKPTRQTVILVSLYKKASSGDLSSIKELLHLIGDTAEFDGGRVVIIDDVESKHQ